MDNAVKSPHRSGNQKTRESQDGQRDKRLKHDCILAMGLDFVIHKDLEKVYERQITRFIFQNEYSSKATLCKKYVRN